MNNVNNNRLIILIISDILTPENEFPTLLRQCINIELQVLSSESSGFYK